MVDTSDPIRKKTLVVNQSNKVPLLLQVLSDFFLSLCTWEVSEVVPEALFCFNTSDLTINQSGHILK